MSISYFLTGLIALRIIINQINSNFWFSLIGIIFLLAVAGCSPIETTTPVNAIPSLCPTCPSVTSVSTLLTTDTQEPTKTPEPRTLTICLGAEPDTLFYYLSSMLIERSVQEAIYDGPIDPLSYSYQPVIIEKIPSLADGDAQIEVVSVQSGDKVVDNNGEVVYLSEGNIVRPFGCQQSDCAVVFDGGAIDMGQLSADFSLLKGLRWSDGEPLTIDDAIFSYDIAKQCDDHWGEWCTQNFLVERTADFIAQDEITARWIGLPGFFDPYYMSNFFQPMPEHQLRDMPVHEMAEAEETALQPMGWGPYMIEEWVTGREIRMKRNPYYFRADEGLPRYDQLVFLFTGENSQVNIAKILAGECDLVDQDAQMDDVLKLLLGMDRQGLLQAHMVNGAVWEHFDFSLLHADYDDGYQIGSDRPDLFGDVRTRQAIAMCLDRERVINEAVFKLSEYEPHYLDPGHPLYDMVYGKGNAPNAYIPPDHPLYNPEVLIYQFNPQEAIVLLEEVGWIDHDGDPSTPRRANSVPNVLDSTLLEFDYWTTGYNQRKRIAQILAESLGKCGIQVSIQYWEAREFFELPDSPVFSRHFDVVEFAWLSGEIPPCDRYLSENIPGDPEVRSPDGSQRFSRGWQGENNSGYSSSEFDQACKAALATLPGQQGFIENHQSAQEIFSRDLPVVPLFYRKKFTAARADMCGYWMDATANSDTWNIEEFGYGDDCDD